MAGTIQFFALDAVTSKYSLVLIASAVLASCSRPSMDVEIPFNAVYNNAAIACSTGNPALTDLRLYLYDVELRAEKGDWTRVSLLEDSAWQQRNLAMIDLESKDCINGTTETHKSLLGRVPAGTYKGLRFKVGVPFEHNHADPLVAAPAAG